MSLCRLPAPGLLWWVWPLRCRVCVATYVTLYCGQSDHGDELVCTHNPPVSQQYYMYRENKMSKTKLILIFTTRKFLSVQYTTHSVGIGTGDLFVFFSNFSMRSIFHCSLYICHVPRQNVVAGIISSHSCPLLCPLLPGDLAIVEEKERAHKVVLTPAQAYA